MLKILTYLFILFFYSNLQYSQTENLKSSRSPSRKPVNQKVFLGEDFQSVQGILSEDFNGDNTPVGLAARGWIFIDNDGEGETTVYNGNFEIFSAYEGIPSGYVSQNFNGAYNGDLLIDQWLISPEFTVDSGNIVSFYWQAVGGIYHDSVYLKISDGGTTIPDFTENLGRFKVPEGGWEKFTYEFTSPGQKRFAFHYYHTSGGPNGNHSNYWGLDYFHVSSGPGFTADPSPFNGEILTDNAPTLLWTNPDGTTEVEVLIGTGLDNLISVYSGPAVTFYDPSPLNYSTTYYWKVDATNSNGTTAGDVWSFTTSSDPSLITLFGDDFEGGLVNWTAMKPNDLCDWGYAAGDIPGSNWEAPPDFPPTASGNYIFASSDLCGGFMNVYLTGNFSVDISLYQNVYIEFDSDFEIFGETDPPDTARIDISTDGGLTWSEAFSRLFDTGAEHVIQDISSLASQQGSVKFRLVYYGDYSWHWALDNFAIKANNPIPVELTSFSASVIDDKVHLNWQTATETNNYGFEIERAPLQSNNSTWSKIGFVAGFGTIAESRNYGFTDNNVQSGKYSYRLKQIDFDGKVNYSDEINIEIRLLTYSLKQNYPNPFNPNTKINFSLQTNSKVVLKVIDVLGQEVATLINQNMNSGAYSYDFDASALNSGIYIYTLEASGTDGTSFKSAGKMILAK